MVACIVLQPFFLYLCLICAIPLMRKLFLTILLSAMAFCQLAAQEITVRSVEEQTTNLRPRTSPVYDNNHELCALLEVAAPALEGIEFDRDKTVGEVTYSKGVYSVYVPVGTKRLGFRHDEYLPGTIDFSDYGITITGGVAYSVILEKPSGPSAVGFLLFSVTPKSALLELDGEALSVGNDGYAQKTVVVGRSYHYTASMKGYHMVEGTVSVSGAGQSEEISIELKEASGSLRIGTAGNSTIAGASVYLDNELLPGTAPMLLNDITSGSHTVKIVRDLYRSMTTTVQVSDGSETMLDPVLENNSAKVNVTAPAGAEIWVDNARTSTGSWAGTLLSGTHIIEARADGNVISSQVFDIIASAQVQDIILSAARGTLIVSSSPVKATVLLDGKEAGVTPLLLSDVEVGSHELTLSKDGFSTETRLVKVSKDANTEVSISLEAAKSSDVVLPATTSVTEPSGPVAATPVLREASAVSPAAPVKARREAEGIFFVGAGAGVNYLKNYDMFDPSIDFRAGYVKRIGGYVHFSKNVTGNFKYEDYDADIHLNRIAASAGFISSIVRNHLYFLTGVGLCHREFSITDTYSNTTYSENDFSQVSFDINLLLRFGHIGCYFGTAGPFWSAEQYSDVHFGLVASF